MTDGKEKLYKNTQMKKFYHNHTSRCKHATGNIFDYCKSAIHNSIEVLGISDHTPLPDNRWNFERMEISELEDYFIEINQAIDFFAQKNLKVLKSMERDYIQEYESFFKNILIDKFGCNYLIGAVHWFIQEDQWVRVPDSIKDHNAVKAYTKQYLQAMHSGLFLFMAHPDLFGIFYPNWDKYSIECSHTILKEAEMLNIPIEINARGYRKSLLKTQSGLRRKYPLDEFWEIASNYKIKVVVSADAHKPENVFMDVHKCYEIVNKYNLIIADFSHF